MNWTYSIRNTLVDWNAPKWMVNRFSLRAAPALAVFTALDTVFTFVGHGALLRVILRRAK